jgi:hypothetical protein
MRGSDPSHDRNGVVVAQARNILTGRFHMKDKRVIGYFAAGLLTAAALYGIYILVHPMAGGDDEPIVVAGGSFEIGSRYGFVNVDAHHASHKHKGRGVTRIDILYNDKTKGPGYKEFDAKQGDMTVGIEYVPKDSSKPHDTVTFSTDKGGNSLAISNAPKCPGIGDEVDANSTTIVHQPDGTVGQITVSGSKLDPTPDPKGYPCDNGKCQVVVHYFCAGGPTACP